MQVMCTRGVKSRLNLIIMSYDSFLFYIIYLIINYDKFAKIFIYIHFGRNLYGHFFSYINCTQGKEKTTKILKANIKSFIITHRLGKFFFIKIIYFKLSKIISK